MYKVNSRFVHLLMNCVPSLKKSCGISFRSWNVSDILTVVCSVFATRSIGSDWGISLLGERRTSGDRGMVFVSVVLETDLKINLR